MTEPKQSFTEEGREFWLYRFWHCGKETVNLMQGPVENPGPDVFHVIEHSALVAERAQYHEMRSMFAVELEAASKRCESLESENAALKDQRKQYEADCARIEYFTGIHDEREQLRAQLAKAEGLLWEVEGVLNTILRQKEKFSSMYAEPLLTKVEQFKNLELQKKGQGDE